MDDIPFRLDTKVALVTGASQGIGRELALGFAMAGASVAIVDLPSKQSASKDLTEQIIATGGTASAYSLDVQNVSAINQVVDQVVADFGSLDIMVNNAGIRVLKSSLEVTEIEWDQVLDVNLKAVFFGSQAAARHMIPRGSGRIINVASQLAITALPQRAAYCASKGGVVNLTRALALEWCNSGITVNAIGPGPTNTPMVQDNQSPNALNELKLRSPIGRRLDPKDMVGAVIFLASPAASGVNGHLLMVDAGWTAW